MVKKEIVAENCAIKAKLEVDNPATPEGEISHATCLRTPFGVIHNPAST